jgi:hypothetical protein
MLVGDIDRRTSPFCEFFYMPQGVLECQGKKCPKVLFIQDAGFRFDYLRRGFFQSMVVFFYSEYKYFADGCKYL